MFTLYLFIILAKLDFILALTKSKPYITSFNILLYLLLYLLLLLIRLAL
jgi:hypothetical protein